MSEIYSRAHTVLVWLGLENENAIKSLKMIDRTRSQGEWLFGYQKYKDAVMPFFTTTYWSRAWIVQEFLLSREPVSMASSEILPFHKYKTIFKTVYDRLYHQPTEFALGTFAERIRNQRYEARDLLPLSPEALDHALVRFSEWKCYDPRDKVYAILGLFSGDFTYEIEQSGAKGEVDLRADYSITEEQLHAKLYWYVSGTHHRNCLDNLSEALLGTPVRRWRKGTASNEAHDPDNIALPPSR